MTKFYELVFNSPAETSFEELDLTTLKGIEGLEERYNNLYKDTNSMVKDTDKTVSNLKQEFKQKLEEVQYKLSKTVEKVRGAVIAERGTSGAIYTTQQQITQQHITNNTTATIKGNIAYGVPKISDTELTNLNYLKASDILFNNANNFFINKEGNEELVNFTVSNKTQFKEVIELTINVTGKIKSNSNVVFNFSNHNIVEVYRDSDLFLEKSIKQVISVPIVSGTSYIKLRIHPSTHKSTNISFKSIGYTDLIYEKDTTIEFKDLSINKDFYQLVVDTCDNSNDKNISIDYFISINGAKYESFSPVSKFKALEKQSIITLNKNKILNMYEVEGKKFSEGDYRFYIPDELETNTLLRQSLFLPNNKSLVNNLTIITKEDTTLSTKAITKDNLYINDKLIEEDVFLLPKGVYTIEAKISDKVESTLSIDYLKSLVQVYSKQLTKDIYTDSENKKYISLNFNDFKDSSEELPNIFMPGIKGKISLNTIKLKAVLKSKDKKTVPYISRILIRGI